MLDMPFNVVTSITQSTQFLNIRNAMLEAKSSCREAKSKFFEM